MEAELSEGLCMIQAARQNDITWNSLIKQQLIQFDLETEGFPESPIHNKQQAGRLQEATAQYCFLQPGDWTSAFLIRNSHSQE